MARVVSGCLGVFRYVSGCCGMSRVVLGLSLEISLVALGCLRMCVGHSRRPMEVPLLSKSGTSIIIVFRMSSLFRDDSGVSGCLGVARDTLESQCVMEGQLWCVSHTPAIPWHAEACGTSRKVAPARQVQRRFRYSAKEEPPFCLFSWLPSVSADVSGRCGVSRSGLGHTANVVCPGRVCVSHSHATTVVCGGLPFREACGSLRELAEARASSRKLAQTRGSLQELAGSSSEACREVPGSSAEARRKLFGSSSEALRKLAGRSKAACRQLAGSAHEARRSSPEAPPKLVGSSSEARRELAGSSSEALRSLAGSSPEARRNLAGSFREARASSGQLAEACGVTRLHTSVLGLGCVGRGLGCVGRRKPAEARRKVLGSSPEGPRKLAGSSPEARRKLDGSSPKARRNLTAGVAGLVRILGDTPDQVCEGWTNEQSVRERLVIQCVLDRDTSSFVLAHTGARVRAAGPHTHEISSFLVFGLLFREIDGRFWRTPKPDQSENTKIGARFFSEPCFFQNFPPGSPSWGAPVLQNTVF